MAYIYKIEVGDAIYIGSTTDMRRRQVQHNSSIQCGDECPIYTYCRENDINKLELIELEYVDIEDRYIVEQYYIDEFKTCHKLLNGVSAKRDRLAYQKAYQEANKDKLKENAKAYREANKEHRRAIHKAYQEANKDKKKEYYQANKEKIKAYKKEHAKANKDKIKSYMKAYYQKNKALTHQPEPQEASV